MVQTTPNKKYERRVLTPDLTPESQRYVRAATRARRRKPLTQILSDLGCYGDCRKLQPWGLDVGSSTRFATTALCLLLLLWKYLSPTYQQLDPSLFSLQDVQRGASRDTLVLYVFSSTDPEAIHNLKYFVREAVRPGDGCDYVFIMQSNENSTIPDLPKLPANARYLMHPNQCYDWGTFGWAINSTHVNASRYQYFIFMNSSVRGPFMPSYLRGSMHWTFPFVR